MRWIMQVVALAGFGLLLGFIGLTMTLNLFGFVDAEARRMSKSLWHRRWEEPDGGASELLEDAGFHLGRFLVGGGALLVGAIAVIGAIVLQVSGPPD